MGHLGLGFVGRHQPRPVKFIEDGLGRGALGRVARQQVRQGHAAAGVLRPLAQFGQFQEDAPGDGLLGRLEIGVGALGRPGDGPADAAGGVVTGVGQLPALAPPPRLQQGVGQQRQRARVLPGVGDDDLGQPRFQFVAGCQRRLLDGLAQFGRVHGADQLLMALQGIAQPGVVQKAMQKIGPQGDDYGGQPGLGHVQQRGDEGGAGGFVLAGGIEFFELIDQQQDARRALAFQVLTQVERGGGGIGLEIVADGPRLAGGGQVARQGDGQLLQRPVGRRHLQVGPARAAVGQVGPLRRRALAAQRGDQPGTHQR